MISNVRNLRVLPAPPPAPVKHKRDPVLYFIGALIALFAGLTAAGLYYAITDPNHWSCANFGATNGVARYFEHCVDKWGLQNRSECLEDARTLFCQKLP